MIQAILQNTDYTTTIQTEAHHFIVDEPKDKGGVDLGPTPMEYLAASLASCTIITIKMYMNRKEWTIRHIEANIERKINAKDNSNIFDLTIEIDGDLDEKQRNRVLYITKACPVHKILSQGSTIRINIKYK